MNLNQLMHKWLNCRVRPLFKLRTFVRYSDVCYKHIAPALGNIRLIHLNDEIIQEYLQNKIDKGNLLTGAPLAPSSVIMIASVIKKLYAYAAELKLIHVNYNVKFIMPVRAKKIVSSLEAQEQRQLEKYCLAHNKRNNIGVIICLYTGLRLGELLALTWRDINFVSRLITVNKTAYTTKTHGVNTVTVDTPKTRSSVRVFPIPNVIMKLLRKRRNMSDSPYVICSRNGSMLSCRSFQRTYKNILIKSNVTYRNFHSLRHTFATRSMEMGMDVKSLSEILGHKNPQITMAYYSHSHMRYKADMMNKLGKSLNES